MSQPFKADRQISIRLTPAFQNSTFWERLSGDEEVQLVNGRVVQVATLTPKMSEAIRQGIIESGYWDPTPEPTDILKNMQLSEDQQRAMSIGQLIDRLYGEKKGDAEEALKQEAAKLGFKLVPHTSGEEWESSDNDKVVRRKVAEEEKALKEERKEYDKADKEQEANRVKEEKERQKAAQAAMDDDLREKAEDRAAGRATKSGQDNKKAPGTMQG